MTPSITTVGLVCNAIGSGIWGIWVTRSLRTLLAKKKEKIVSPFQQIPLPVFEDETETLPQMPIGRVVGWHEALEQQMLLASSCFLDIVHEVKDGELLVLTATAQEACMDVVRYLRARRG